MKLDSERLEFERHKEEMVRREIEEQKSLGIKMKRLEQLQQNLEQERDQIREEREKLRSQREDLNSVRLVLQQQREVILRDEQRVKEVSDRLTGIALKHEINALRNEVSQVTAKSLNDEQDEVKSSNLAVSKHTGVVQYSDMSAHDLPKADVLSDSSQYVVFTNSNGEQRGTSDLK